MQTFLFILLMGLMLSVVGVLGLGMLGLARGGDPARANRLMRLRVMLQGAAVLVFLLLLATRH